ncbi:MAG TPA: hypothetical protein VE934_11990 [Polaromonas sp.]|uniref:hypothetical protein n=1 Tax=Polaromonas sp. TaxID=1869339 RepID=UPI002D4D0280|nr:hypothetical protein [Polaromonas sp.]HYW57676.1 hypothetical protein [Polaromonas sp.]
MQDTHYTLKHPFTARIKGQDEPFTTLPLPEVVTVGLMRKVQASGSLLFAHELTEACAGLGPFEAAKLQTPDAVGYIEAIEALLLPNEQAGFELPEIKVFKALLKKITVEPNRPTEFVAQVLQHSGMPRAEIDAMDYRDFAPVIETVLEMFPGPKS